MRTRVYPHGAGHRQAARDLARKVQDKGWELWYDGGRQVWIFFHPLTGDERRFRLLKQAISASFPPFA